MVLRSNIDFIIEVILPKPLMNSWSTLLVKSQIVLRVKQILQIYTVMKQNHYSLYFQILWMHCCISQLEETAAFEDYFIVEIIKLCADLISSPVSVVNNNPFNVGGLGYRHAVHNDEQEYNNNASQQLFLQLCIKDVSTCKLALKSGSQQQR